jgi:hypothetical protein
VLGASQQCEQCLAIIWLERQEDKEHIRRCTVAIFLGQLWHTCLAMFYAPFACAPEIRAPRMFQGTSRCPMVRTNFGMHRCQARGKPGKNTPFHAANSSASFVWMKSRRTFWDDAQVATPNMYCYTERRQEAQNSRQQEGKPTQNKKTAARSQAKNPNTSPAPHRLAQHRARHTRANTAGLNHLSRRPLGLKP